MYTAGKRQAVTLPWWPLANLPCLPTCPTTFRSGPTPLTVPAAGPSPTPVFPFLLHFLTWNPGWFPTIAFYTGKGEQPFPWTGEPPGPLGRQQKLHFLKGSVPLGTWAAIFLIPHRFLQPTTAKQTGCRLGSHANNFFGRICWRHAASYREALSFSHCLCLPHSD